MAEPDGLDVLDVADAGVVDARLLIPEVLETGAVKDTPVLRGKVLDSEPVPVGTE